MNKSLIRFTLPAILPALALAACQKAPSTADAVSSGVVLDDPAAVSSSESGSDTAPVTDAKTYLEKAGAGDKFEIDPRARSSRPPKTPRSRISPR
jgi:putative membrane protein